jgi:hypothetical protein
MVLGGGHLQTPWCIRRESPKDVLKLTHDIVSIVVNTAQIAFAPSEPDLHLLGLLQRSIHFRLRDGSPIRRTAVEPERRDKHR